MEKTHGELVCDGCGQLASAEHIAKRLRRLEWATRHRPLHIQTVLLGAAAPSEDTEFLYAPDGGLAGEAGLLAEAAGLAPADCPKDQLHAAFQRAGFFAIHVRIQLRDIELEAREYSRQARCLIRFAD